MGKVRESLKLKKTLWEAADFFWAFRSSWPWAFYSLKNLFCIEWNVSVLCLLATVVGWWVDRWSHLFACRTLKQGSQVGCAHHCVLGTTLRAARQPRDISLCVCTFVHDLLIYKGWMITICPHPQVFWDLLMQNACSMFIPFLAPPAPVMTLTKEATAWRAGHRHLPSS